MKGKEKHPSLKQVVLVAGLFSQEINTKLTIGAQRNHSEMSCYRGRSGTRFKKKEENKNTLENLSVYFNI